MACEAPRTPIPVVAVSARLLASVARLLIINGQTTEGVHLAVERLSQTLGQPTRVRARWGEFVLTQAGEPSGTWYEAEPVGVDIGRVKATEDVVDALCTGQVGIETALTRLAAIERLPPVSLARFAPMAAAGAAALAVIFGAPDLLTVYVVAAIAGIGACLRRAVSYGSANALLQPLMAALLAGVGGGLAARFHLPAEHRLIMACPCMVLVPGPHFLNGMIDLVRVRLAIGMARLALAGLIVLAICMGLMAGLTAVGAAFPPSGATIAVPLPVDVAAAGIAVAAYGSFFNMPWRLLGVPIGIGMAAHTIRWVFLSQGASVPLGALGAALVAGLTITPLSHRFGFPFGASAFASVVSMVPGVYMFEIASDLVTVARLGPTASLAPLLDAMTAGSTAALTLLAMAVGLIVPKLCIDQLWSRFDRQQSSI